MTKGQIFEIYIFTLGQTLDAKKIISLLEIN